MGAGGFMTHNESIGLRAVQKAKSHSRKCRMKQRSLSFDDLPGIFIIVRGNPLCGARYEVGNNGIK